MLSHDEGPADFAENIRASPFNEGLSTDTIFSHIHIDGQLHLLSYRALTMRCFSSQRLHLLSVQCLTGLRGHYLLQISVVLENYTKIKEI